MNYLSQALLVFTQNPHFYFYKNYPNFSSISFKTYYY